MILFPPGKVICEMKGSGEKDVNNAVAAAKKAQKEWGAMSGYERGKIVIKCAELLTVRIVIIFIYNNTGAV